MGKLRGFSSHGMPTQAGPGLSGPGRAQVKNDLSAVEYPRAD